MKSFYEFYRVLAEDEQQLMQPQQQQMMQQNIGSQDALPGQETATAPPEGEGDKTLTAKDALEGLGNMMNPDELKKLADLIMQQSQGPEEQPQVGQAGKPASPATGMEGGGAPPGGMPTPSSNPMTGQV